MRCFPKIVVSLFVALTGAIGSGYAKENQNDFQDYLISERDNIILNFQSQFLLEKVMLSFIKQMMIQYLKS